MIEANDLRVGNLVRSNNPLHRPNELGKTLHILEIKDEMIVGVAVEDMPCAFTFGQFLKYIDPIPLTEEWLDRMGFKKERVSGIGGQDQWAGMGAYSYEGEWLFRNHGNLLFLVGYFNAQFQFVHEVQNIFHSLYHKELDIKTT